MKTRLVDPLCMSYRNKKLPVFKMQKNPIKNVKEEK